MNAITTASDECRLAGRRYLCHAAWRECDDTIGVAQVRASPDAFTFRETRLQSVILEGDEEFRRAHLKPVPRALCYAYREACTPAELETGYTNFKRLLTMFKLVTHRSDDENELVARLFFDPDCDDGSEFADRDEVPSVCSVTNRPMPEPPLAGLLSPAPGGTGRCADIVQGQDTCCDAQDEEDLHASLPALVRGADEDEASPACVAGARQLLCEAGCGYKQRDAAAVDDLGVLQLRMGVHFCKQLFSDCACDVSGISGRVLSDEFTSPRELCAHIARALVPVAARAHAPAAVTAVNVTLADAEVDKRVILLGGGSEKPFCEMRQAQPEVAAEGLDASRACTAQGSEVHAVVPAPAGTGACSAWYGPGQEANGESCCLDKHAHLLDANLRLAKAVLKSHECYHELAKLACTTLCSPAQSRFADTANALPGATAPAPRNADGSINATVHVSEEWCADIVGACADEEDPRNHKTFRDNFGMDPKAMCGLLGPYFNALLTPGEDTPTYTFVAHAKSERPDSGALMLADRRCYEARTCDARDDVCPLAADGRVPVPWDAAARLLPATSGTAAAAAFGVPAGGAACSEHSASACCSPREAEAIALWPASSAVGGLGPLVSGLGGACKANVTQLFCGLGCSADQADFASPDGSAYVLEKLCAAILSACAAADVAGALAARGITSAADMCQGLGQVYASVAPAREGPAVRIVAQSGRGRRAQYGWRVVPRNVAVLGKTCPLNDDEEFAPAPLALCRQHADAACCSSDAELAGRFAQLKAHFGGGDEDSACLRGVLSLTCATSCSARQSYFVHLERDEATGEPRLFPEGDQEATSYVALGVCEDLFAQCKDVTSHIFGETFGSMYPTPSELCQSFSVTSDPTYEAKPGNTRLVTRVGVHPDTGYALGSADMPGVPSPLPMPAEYGAAASTKACLDPTVEAKARNLGFCGRYRDLSCCEEEDEAGIGGNLTAVAARVFGHGCCFERLSELVCGLACSPDQMKFIMTGFVEADRATQARNVSLFVSRELADALWHDCAKHKMLATTTVETYFEGPAALLAKIAENVKNDRVAGVTITIGEHPFEGGAVGAGTTGACTDPPPLSELSMGWDQLPTIPHREPGMVAMYLLLFAAGLALAFLAVLALCGRVAVTAPSATLPKSMQRRISQDVGGESIGASNDPGPRGPRASAPSVPSTPTAAAGANGAGANGAADKGAHRPEPQGASGDDLGTAAFVYERVEDGYYALAHFCASRPSLCVAGLLALVAGASALLPFLELKTQPTELWVAQGQPSVWQRAYTEGNFGAQRHEVMIITTKEPGGDVLRPEVLSEAADLEHLLRTTTFEGHGGRAALEDVCAKVRCRAGGPEHPQECIFQSPLKYWHASDFREDPDLYATVSNLAAKDECGIPILRKTVLGGLETGALGRVVGAKSLMMAVVLEPQPLDMARAWEYGFLAAAEETNARSKFIQVSYLAQISQDEEVARLAAADVPLLVASYVMMIGYVVYAMLGSDRTSSHVLLGLQGVALVICSIVIMLGLTVVFGVPFTPVSTQVLPFLLLGIGVDNIFILVSTYATRLREERSKRYTEAELVGSILAQVGPTITLTSTSTTLAFLVGSLSVMPAVKYFCQQCVIGFAVNLLLQLTVFQAAIAADCRRVRRRRVDFIPCLTTAYDKAEAKASAQVGAFLRSPTFALLGGAASEEQPPMHHQPEPEKEDALSRWMRGSYVSWLSRRSVQAGVLLLFAALTAGGVSAALRVGQGLEIGEVLPRGSYMSTFFERFEFFSDIGPPVYIVQSRVGVDPDDDRSPTRRVDFTDYEVQDALGELVEALELSPWIKPPALDWLGDFQKWALIVSNHTQEVIDNGGRVPQHLFYTWLGEFLEPGTDFAFYSNYLSFDEEGMLDSAKVMGFHVPLQSTTMFVQAMLDMRALCAPFAAKAGMTVFPYSEYHVFYEQYAILVPQATKLLFSAITVILLVMTFLLGNVLLSLPVLLLLTLNQIDLIGVMYLARVHMNGISIINLVMAIGLSVEYLAHIASTYNMSEGDHVRKMRHAMASVGSSVVSGAFTTLLGVVVLAFAKYPVFQVYYFRMYLATVLCGSIHGLVLLPVVLGLIAPSRASRDKRRGRVLHFTPVKKNGSAAGSDGGQPRTPSAQRERDQTYGQLL